MNKRDYNALVKRLDEARKNTIETAEREFEEGTRALQRLWQLMGGEAGGNVSSGSGGGSTGSSASGGGGGSSTGNGRRKKKTGRRGPGRPRKTESMRATGTTKKKTTRKKRRASSGQRGALINAMRDAVSKTSGEFTISDVKQRLEGNSGVDIRNTNPAVFSTTMKRLEELGEVRLIKRGRGRRASVYRSA